ncbi:MAG: 30S ribosomal protein S4 [Patescibacteria group bacterium]
MARYLKLKLKTRQKYGLASPEDSIRRKKQIVPRKTDYGQRLEQKQKLKYIYGVMEKQMKRYASEAFKGKGDAQVELLIKLEMRLDNVVYRLGFGKTREQCRQLVNHGHILVDNKKVDIASYRLRIGEVVSLSEKAAKKRIFSEKIQENRKVINTVSYLEYKPISGRILSIPGQDDLAQNVDIAKVMEFYRDVI